MKRIFYNFCTMTLLMLNSFYLVGQSTSIDSKGIYVPKLTTAQRNLISNPQTGQLIYNTDENCINIRKNGTWQSLCSIVGTGTVKVINTSQVVANDPLVRNGASTIYITANANSNDYLNIKGIDGGVEGTLINIVLDNSLLCPDSGSPFNLINAVPLTVTLNNNIGANPLNAIIVPQNAPVVLQSGSCTYTNFLSFMTEDYGSGSVSLVYVGGKWRILSFSN